MSILTFLIKLVENGKGSEILKQLPEASELQIEEGKGHFLLKDTTNPKVFLSTGSGLAPCYRMAKEDKSWSQKRFFFSVSYAKDLFYVEEIKNLNIPETHISISREEVEGFEYGRINIDHIDFPAETEFYICWVPLMVKEFLTNLRARGYKNIFVHRLIVLPFCNFPINLKIFILKPLSHKLLILTQSFNCFIFLNKINQRLLSFYLIFIKKINSKVWLEMLIQKI